MNYFSLDSRTDLPKVRYATALDWFLLMSFFYCIATLLEFAGVHYFTKVGSGEIHALADDEWEDIGGTTVEHAGTVHTTRDSSPSQNQLLASSTSSTSRKRNSMICPIYNVNDASIHTHFDWFNYYWFCYRIHQLCLLQHHYILQWNVLPKPNHQKRKNGNKFGFAFWETINSGDRDNAKLLKWVLINSLLYFNRISCLNYLFVIIISFQMAAISGI